MPCNPYDAVTQNNRNKENKVKRDEPRNCMIENEPSITYYKPSRKFQLFLPDKSGTVYYPNGQIAIILSDTGMYQSFLAFHYDEKNPVQLASFDSNGTGCCNHLNGKIKYILK